MCVFSYLRYCVIAQISIFKLILFCTLFAVILSNFYHIIYEFIWLFQRITSLLPYLFNSAGVIIKTFNILHVV
jgi:CBS domain containing-hemolysin-like protein